MNPSQVLKTMCLSALLLLLLTSLVSANTSSGAGINPCDTASEWSGGARTYSVGEYALNNGTVYRATQEATSWEEPQWNNQTWAPFDCENDGTDPTDQTIISRRIFTALVRDHSADQDNFQGAASAGGKGMVLDTLSSTGVPIKNSEKVDPGSSNLNEWFVTKDGNDTCIDMIWKQTSEGNWEYDSDDYGGFFPIDDFNHANNSKNVYGHNYHFTMELHLQFKYEEGTAQLFEFIGDDDVWIFINGTLAIDIGGIHGPQAGSVNLDTEKSKLDLIDGQTYALDIFFCERQTTGSNFRASTSIDISNHLSLFYDSTSLPSGAVQYDTKMYDHDTDNLCGYNINSRNADTLPATVDYFITGPTFESELTELSSGLNYGGINILNSSTIIVDTSTIINLNAGEYTVSFTSQEDANLSGALQFTVAGENREPKEISLSETESITTATIPEESGDNYKVGSLNSVVYTGDIYNQHTYSIVGESYGFTISGSDLHARNFDFETETDRGPYIITIRSTDDGPNGGLSLEQNFTITIDAVNDNQPVQSDTTVSTIPFGKTTVISLPLANDLDFPATSVTLDSTIALDGILGITTLPQFGVLEYLGEGHFSYTPNMATLETTDEFTYQMLDSTDYDASNVHRVTARVILALDQSTKDYPIANDDLLTLDEGATATINVLADNGNGEDTKGQVGDVLTGVELIVAPVYATSFELLPDGTLSYTHDGSENFNDMLRYRVIDAGDRSGEGIVYITINPLNDNTPVLINEAVTVLENSTVTVAVISPEEKVSDIDMYTNIRVAELVKDGSMGTATITNDLVTYTQTGDVITGNVIDTVIVAIEDSVSYDSETVHVLYDTIFITIIPIVPEVNSAGYYDTEDFKDGIVDQVIVTFDRPIDVAKTQFTLTWADQTEIVTPVPTVDNNSQTLYFNGIYSENEESLKTSGQMYLQITHSELFNNSVYTFPVIDRTAPILTSASITTENATDTILALTFSEDIVDVANNVNIPYHFINQNSENTLLTIDLDYHDAPTPNTLTYLSTNFSTSDVVGGDSVSIGSAGYIFDLSGNEQVQSVKIPLLSDFGSTDVYSIKPVVDGGNGTISPSVLQTIKLNDATTFSFIAADGYRVAEVLVDNNSVEYDTVNSQYTFPSSTSGQKVLAVSFEKIEAPLAYTVTPSVESDGGTITPATVQAVVHGADSPEFTISPAEGYTIKSVKIDGVETSINGTTYTFESVTSNHTIDVLFEEDVLLPTYYTLLYTAGDKGSILGESSQLVVSGADGSAVTAVPAAGYTFSGWSDGVTEATRIDLDNTVDLSVSANFDITTALMYRDDMESVISFGGVHITPNPANSYDGSVNIYVNAIRDGSTSEIVILDYLGNVIDQQKYKTALNGACHFTWDLRNGNGQQVSSGMYKVIAITVSSDGIQSKSSALLGVKQ